MQAPTIVCYHASNDREIKIQSQKDTQDSHQWSFLTGVEIGRTCDFPLKLPILKQHILSRSNENFNYFKKET